ncbi:hypothetical protein [Nocardioides immobilis]|uniref:hypothetical protein n=1 Tax=Nocardioides immobilis TaxID=2049295 RepID=UPI0015FCA3F7|nr:hypothetical protein [Nocardioides immobilis]
MMHHWTAAVRDKDVDFLLVAITLGGGTVTQSRPDIAGNVEITYVMGGAGS